MDASTPALTASAVSEASQTKPSAKGPCRLLELPVELVHRIFDFGHLRSRRDRFGMILTQRDGTKHEIILTIDEQEARSPAHVRNHIHCTPLGKETPPMLREPISTTTANGTSVSQVGGRLTELYEDWSSQKREFKPQHALEVRNLARLLVASVDFPDVDYAEVQITAQHSRSGWQVALNGSYNPRDDSPQDAEEFCHRSEGIFQPCWLLGADDCTQSRVKESEAASGQLKNWLGRLASRQNLWTYDAEAIARKLRGLRIDFIPFEKLSGEWPLLTINLYQECS